MLTDSMNIKTFAKINLSLDVTGVRPDGFHEVEMVMQGCELYDEMTVSVKQALRTGISNVKLTCDRADIPCDSSNTAWKAAELMLQKACTPLEVSIDIKKHIPSAAGLAGGSSNAAGVLVALNKMMLLNLSLDELMAMGKKIGSDVPFSVMITALGNNLGGTSFCALATGTGTDLTPLPAAPLWVVLAKESQGVSTAGVYKALDELEGYPHPDTKMVIRGVELEHKMGKMEADPTSVMEKMENNSAAQMKKMEVDATSRLEKMEADTSNGMEELEIESASGLDMITAGMANVLENVTLAKYPAVAELKGIMTRLHKEILVAASEIDVSKSAGTLKLAAASTSDATESAEVADTAAAKVPTMMSGSGPTVYSLFRSEEEARTMSAELTKVLEKMEGTYDVFCVRTLV